MSGRKRYGVTVNAYFDGQGYDSDISLTCDNTSTQHLCPYALGETMPMPEGTSCCFRDGCYCRKLVANIEALKVAKAAITKKLKELEAEIEQ